MTMTTQTTVLTASKSTLLPIVLAALMGIAIMFVAGHIQASALHDAAHDARHATGFPCH
jgi:cobalt transporter subunit CbtB